jgi:hypothetical protein
MLDSCAEQMIQNFVAIVAWVVQLAVAVLPLPPPNICGILPYQN